MCDRKLPSLGHPLTPFPNACLLPHVLPSSSSWQTTRCKKTKDNSSLAPTDAFDSVQVTLARGCTEA
jgi:hypothetical protein